MTVAATLTSSPRLRLDEPSSPASRIQHYSRQHEPIVAPSCQRSPKKSIWIIMVSVPGILLLAAEDAALKKDTRPAKYQDELVGVRVLGFLLLDFYKHSNYHEMALFHINIWSGKLYRVSRYQLE